MVNKNILGARFVDFFRRHSFVRFNISNSKNIEVKNTKIQSHKTQPIK